MNSNDINMKKLNSTSADYHHVEKNKSSINNVLVEGKDYFRTKTGVYINLCTFMFIY